MTGHDAQADWEAYLLNHPDRDIQNLIDQYVDNARLLQSSKRDYLRAMNSFWKKNSRSSVGMLISVLKHKIDGQRAKAAEKGIKLVRKPPSLSLFLSQDYKAACSKYFELNISDDRLFQLLGDAEGKMISELNPEHDDLKRQLLENFKSLYPKHFATSDVEKASLAYLKNASQLTLREILKDSVKRKFKVKGDRLQQFITESVQQRFGGERAREQRFGVDLLLGAAGCMLEEENNDLGDEDSRVNQGVADEKAGRLLGPASKEDEALNFKAVPRNGTLEDLNPCSLPMTPSDSGQEAVGQCFAAADAYTDYQGASCRDDMGEAKTCFVCEATAVPCKGHGGSACVVQGTFCGEHCLQGVCHLCRPALPRALNTRRGACGVARNMYSKKCASCGRDGSDVKDALSICTQCNGTYCNDCALRWEAPRAGRPQQIICATDATRSEFYNERHVTARAFAKEVEAALEMAEKTSSPPCKRLLSLVDRFCLMMCMLHRHLQAKILKELYPVLKKVLDYQTHKGLPPAAILQSERLHSFCGEQTPDEFVQRLTRMARNAYVRQGHQDHSNEQQPLKPRKRAFVELPSALPAAESRVAAGALICNLGATNDSLNQLVYNAFKQVMADFDLYLLVLNSDAGNMQKSIKDLVDSAGRCICFKGEETDSEIAWRINSLGLRAVLDCVGTMPTLLRHLDGKTCIVQLADGPVPCDGSTWDGCVVDRQTLKALDSRTDAVKGRYLFSSRWPPLDRRVVNGVNRERFRVRDPNSPFNIFVAARMDTLGPDDRMMLSEILRSMPDAIIHLWGLPMHCINGILEDFRQVDEKDHVGSQPLRDALRQQGTELNCAAIASRIKFMRALPLLEHLQRLRENMDVAVKPRGGDGFDVFTHTTACVTAGLGVLSVGGRGAAGELELLGLEGLVLGNDGDSDTVTERMIRDLVTYRANRAFRDVIRVHLDWHAWLGTSFFDQARYPQDIKALIQQLPGGRNCVLDCATCAPGPPVISRGSNGTLVLAGTTDPQFNSLPPDIGDVWNEVSGPMSVVSEGLIHVVPPPLDSTLDFRDGAGRHGCVRIPRHRKLGVTPSTTDLAGSNKVDRPRPLPMTLPLTIFHCRLPGATCPLSRMTAPRCSLLP